MMSSTKAGQPTQRYRRPRNHKKQGQSQKQQSKEIEEAAAEGTRTRPILTGDAEIEAAKANHKELLRSPAGSICSTCSTAVPPTPIAERMAGLRQDSGAWPEDDDDDEILDGFPLWSYSGPLLDEVLKAMDSTVPAQ